ncbi:MAG: diaminopimelate decarboxylase [Oscillospiraceae bacterium]|nr:diaminopimelate decarboxylase [Oscillospiraceae bacterium]
MICKNLEIKNNTLYFGGRNTKELAEKYGTALYVMDEVTIRENCRKYVNALNKYFGEGSKPFFASKACSFKKIYNIVESEGMGVDVVSVGEIYTAKMAGYNLENACFHSNCKSDSDIIFAMEQGVGCFVVDNKEELDAVSKFAGERGIKQKILFRLTPGIDTHTYDAVNTGKVDSKFGFPIETGAALEITEYALTKENIDLKGFHCHVGSQLFESSVFVRSAEIMLNFIAEAKEKTGFEAEILDLGGGYGVRYTEDDPEIDIEDNIRQVSEFIKEKCQSLNIKVPAIYMEPGRSIVADASLTLYTVGSVKRIKGYKNYVAVDGGMGDNPRYALYKSQYTVVAADKAEEECNFKCDLVGKCCESGDILQPNIMLPETVGRGDLIAVLTTGAYNYSMASNYNRIPRLPIIIINGDEDYVAVKRESLDDIVRNDV